MEEERLPWWRRALRFALGGIRSGFGLFSRSPKTGAANDPEIVAGQKEDSEEEAELIEDSPKLEPIAEPVHESQPDASVEVAEVEPRSDRVATVGVDPQIESAEPEPALVAAEEDSQFAGQSESASAGAKALDDSEAVAARLKSCPVTEPVRDSVTEPVEVSAEASLCEDDGALGDSDADAARPETTFGSSVAPTGLTDFHPAFPGLRPGLFSTAPSGSDLPDGSAGFSSPLVGSGPMGGQLGSCPDAEQPGASTKPGVSASGEPAEQEPEVEAEQEAEAVAGPTASAESTFADEPVLEEAASPVELSVELKEPAIEEPRKKTAGQPAANEGESPEQTASVAEAAPETEPAIEQAAEIDPEPAKIPMELNEPIREQEGEPAASSETAPVAQPASEEDAGDLAAVPAETFVAESAAVAIAAEAPAAEAAAEPAVEDVAIPAQEPAPAAPQKPFIKLESRDNEADLSPFSVVVSQVYDGPLDLLLDLIRKQDIDIYDIPIARITAQFLAYVNQLKATDVDVAGEFIYTASLLIHIKSKMLLPRAPAGPDDAAEDPRRELVERLLEHARFKSAAQMLQQKQMLEAATWTNPGLREFQDDAGAEPEIAADTVDLVRVFRDILERARNRPVINVEEDSVTVGQMIQFLSRRLTMEDKPVALRRLLSHTRSERALIAMFLALLELVRLQAILLRQDRAFSEIFIKKHTGFESVMNDGLANARDDWR